MISHNYQVWYDEVGCPKLSQKLYVNAQSEEMRELWIKKIRECMSIYRHHTALVISHCLYTVVVVLQCAILKASY